MLVNLKKTTIKKSTTPFETYYTKQIQQRAKKHKIYTLFMYIYTCIYACKCKYIYIYIYAYKTNVYIANKKYTFIQGTLF